MQTKPAVREDLSRLHIGGTKWPKQKIKTQKANPDNIAFA